MPEYKKFEIDGVSFSKITLPIWMISCGEDWFLKFKDGKIFNKVYQLYAEKGEKCMAYYFRPDFPLKKAINKVLDCFR